MEDDSWVFDSLVGFLRGPVWNVPVLTFIEQKSLIFEPECSNEEEQHKIHDEYKNLVDFMLGSYMEDIGITPEQFEAACGKQSSNIKNQFHQSLFEQVWAADDFSIFQPMMIQKNLELQLQALEILQKRYGIIPKSCIPGDDMSSDEQAVMEQVIKAPNAKSSSGSNSSSEEERKILEAVLKKSLEEHEALAETMDAETRDLEKAIADSLAEKDKLEFRRQREKDLLDKALRLPLSDSAPPASSTSEPPSDTNAAEIDPEQLRRRQEYLKEQRDKLLALKREEREKQLKQFEDEAPVKRPKSSRAARKVMTGSTIDAHTLQVRKALAERLKNEVIEN